MCGFFSSGFAAVDGMGSCARPSEVWSPAPLLPTRRFSAVAYQTLLRCCLPDDGRLIFLSPSCSRELLDALFQMALQAQGEEGASISALSCLSECLSARCIPVALEPFLAEVGNYTVQLLTALVAKKESGG